MSTVAKALNFDAIKAIVPENELRNRGVAANMNIDDIFEDGTLSGFWCCSAGWGTTGLPVSPDGTNYGTNYGMLIQLCVKKGSEPFSIQIYFTYSASVSVILWRVRDQSTRKGWYLVKADQVLPPASSGGVIYYPSSAESQKGGWQYERRSQSSLECGAERHHGRRSLRQRSHRRHECGQSIGSLCCGPKHHSESSERHEVGQSAPTKFAEHDWAAHLRLVARKDVCKDGIDDKLVALVQSYIRDIVAGKEVAA